MIELRAISQRAHDDLLREAGIARFELLGVGQQRIGRVCTLRYFAEHFESSKAGGGHISTVPQALSATIRAMVYLGMAIAGVAGVMTRYWISVRLAEKWGASFPWGTLAVNLVGCLIIGLIMELARETNWVSNETRMIVVTGFLGALTTFSSFGIETWRLVELGDWRGASWNVLANVVGGLGCVVAGALVARKIAG
jgi:CrcB protein